MAVDYAALTVPELPEVEITARLVGAAAAGATIESALAPGLNALKTFDPPLTALEGGRVLGIGRRGKLFRVEIDAADGRELTLLIHLMSAGRLQLFESRASLRIRPRGYFCDWTTGASCGCVSSEPSSGLGRSCFRVSRSTRRRRWPLWALRRGRTRPQPLSCSRCFPGRGPCTRR